MWWAWTSWLVKVPACFKSDAVKEELKLTVVKVFSTLKRWGTVSSALTYLLTPFWKRKPKVPNTSSILSRTKTIQAIKQLTTKGCKAAINFTNSAAAYAAAPDVLRINGLLLVVG